MTMENERSIGAGTDPGSKSAAEIEREVRQQRADVERTLDAIQERLSPGQLFDEAMTYLREGSGGDFVRNLGDSVKQNPMPIVLIGVGVAWMMASSGRRSGPARPYWVEDDDDLDELDELDAYEAAAYPAAEYPYETSARSSAYDETSARSSAYGAGAASSAYSPGAASSGGAATGLGATGAAAAGSGSSAEQADEGPGLGERAKATAASARERAEQLRGKAHDAASRARAGVSDAAGRARAGVDEMSAGARARMARARRGLSQGAEQTRAYARRYGRRAQQGLLHTLDEQPLVLGAIGLAVGAALGSALPRTEREDRLMGETRDQLKRRAFETGREQLAKAEAAAGAAYDAARDEADRQGLTPEEGRGAVDAARQKVERVAEAASSAAKDEAGRQGLGKTGPGGTSTTTG